MKLYYLSILAFFFISCLHKVSIHNFPQSKSQINYEKVKSEQNFRNMDLRFGSKQEFYFSGTFNNSEEYLINLIKEVVKNEGFKIKKSDIQQDFLIFEKGLSLEAWKSIIGIYYNINESTNSLEVYLLYQMTQDITGSFDVNFAEIRGDKIRFKLRSTNN